MVSLKTAFEWFNPDNIRIGTGDDDIGCLVEDSWLLTRWKIGPRTAHRA